jgi:hypothetical protein
MNDLINPTPFQLDLRTSIFPIPFNSLIQIISFLRTLELIPGLDNDKGDKVACYVGEFEVKNAYIIARQQRGGEIEEDGSFHAFWKRLWSLHMPEKIKIFIWRVCKGILPTKVALSSRGMEVSKRCASCPDQERRNSRTVPVFSNSRALECCL